MNLATYQKAREVLTALFYPVFTINWEWGDNPLIFTADQEQVKCFSINFSHNSHQATKPGTLDGIQIIFEEPRQYGILPAQSFEVSEYMAGPKENQLHILAHFDTMYKALKYVKKLAEGQPKPKPVKIYK
jgi:hypothetical protein